MFPKNSSEYLNTFIYLFSDVCRLGPKYESEGTKIWKTVKGVCRVLEPIFRMRKNQEVRNKKSFENWLTVSGSKIEL